MSSSAYQRSFHLTPHSGYGFYEPTSFAANVSEAMDQGDASAYRPRAHAICAKRHYDSNSVQTNSIPTKRNAVGDFQPLSYLTFR
jgi:hypothetical protein